MEKASHVVVLSLGALEFHPKILFAWISLENDTKTLKQSIIRKRKTFAYEMQIGREASGVALRGPKSLHVT
jgi:hypothetical protein